MFCIYLIIKNKIFFRKENNGFIVLNKYYFQFTSRKIITCYFKKPIVNINNVYYSMQQLVIYT